VTRLAGQTVTFVTFTIGATRGELGMKVETPVETSVEGCRFRPMHAEEIQASGFDAGMQMWRCTAPYDGVTSTIDDNGYLMYGGATFAVIGGAQPFTDMDGAPFKVTILAQKTS
jgi:hypothetical protein